MTWDWQQVVALVCVAAALVVLGRRVRGLWTAGKSAGCGTGCHTCPVHEPTAGVTEKPLVTLELGNRNQDARSQKR